MEKESITGADDGKGGDGDAFLRFTASDRGKGGERTVTGRMDDSGIALKPYSCTYDAMKSIILILQGVKMIPDVICKRMLHRLLGF